MSPLRTIGHLFDSLTDLRPLLQRAQALIGLQKHYAKCIGPALAERSRITHEEAGVVHIQADSAAIAAKLRNLAPRIHADLRTRWPNLTGIQIGTQPTPVQRPTTGARILDHTGKHALDALGERLPEGDLKTVIQRLSQR